MRSFKMAWNDEHGHGAPGVMVDPCPRNAGEYVRGGWERYALTSAAFDGSTGAGDDEDRAQVLLNQAAHLLLLGVAARGRTARVRQGPAVARDGGEAAGHALPARVPSLGRIRAVEPLQPRVSPTTAVVSVDGDTPEDAARAVASVQALARSTREAADVAHPRGRER